MGVLEYGRALRDYKEASGSVRVYGTNGPVGWTDSKQGSGPTVVVGRKGAYRGVHYSAGSFWVIDTAYWLRLTAEVDVRWAYYQLLAQDINSLDSGSAIPSLSRADFSGIEVTLPPLLQQRAIAEVLGALDDKIEANRSVTSIGSSLLAEQFSSQMHPGLSNVTDGEPLPSGWRRNALETMLTVLETGKRPRGGVGSYSEGVPSLGAESVLGLAVYDYAKTKYVPVDFFRAMRRGIVEDRDVLLYKDGGRPGEFEPHVSMLGTGFPFKDFCINEHVYRLRAEHPLTQEYLYFWLSSPPILEAMRRSGTGVAIPGLNSTAVKALPIIVPPVDVVEKFTSVAEPLVLSVLAAARETRSLATLRDALLPKLLSGELRVRDAETVVGKAV